MHFYAWKKGLKTGMYYLRTKAATDAIKFTVDKKALENTPNSADANGKQQRKPKLHVQSIIQMTVKCGS